MSQNWVRSSCPPGALKQQRSATAVVLWQLSCALAQLIGVGGRVVAELVGASDVEETVLPVVVITLLVGVSTIVDESESVDEAESVDESESVDEAESVGEADSVDSSILIDVLVASPIVVLVRNEPGAVVLSTPLATPLEDNAGLLVEA